MGKSTHPDKAWRAECLVDYVRGRMTPQEFADHTGYALTNVYRILMGVSWKDTPRPEGFMYPWPERANLGSRGSFRRRQDEYVAAITAMRTEGLTKHEVAERLKLSYQTVDDIIRRLTRKGLIPPEAT
jgi:hypothetical protein